MRFKSPTRGLPFHPLERSGALHPDRAALASAAWTETLFAARIAPVHPIPGLESDLLRAAARDFKHRLHRHARIDRIERIGFRHGGNARDGAAARDEDDVERAWCLIHPKAGVTTGRGSGREGGGPEVYR